MKYIEMIKEINISTCRGLDYESVSDHSQYTADLPTSDI